MWRNPPIVSTDLDDLMCKMVEGHCHYAPAIRGKVALYTTGRRHWHTCPSSHNEALQITFISS